MDKTQQKTNLARWLVNRLTRTAGLKSVKGFEVRDLFKEVFSAHSAGEIEDFFMVGSSRTTPDIADVNASWPKPWLFFRAFLVSIVIYLLFHFAWLTFENAMMVPGLIITGSFAVPVSTLILFVELNARRNVSMYQVSKMVVVGGLVAMIATLLLFEASKGIAPGWLGNSIGGLVEEPAKVLALLLVASLTRYKYILNGLLFGAAVGAGFAAFESAGYAFVTGVSTFSPGAVTQTIISRGILSPLTHIVWTAMCGAALWKVKGDQLFRFSMLLDPRFLRVLGFAVVLHMAWNAPFQPLFIAKHLLVGFVGWVVVLALVSEGLAELQTEKDGSTNPTKPVGTGDLSG